MTEIRGCFQGDFSGTSEEGGIKHCLQLEDAAVLNPVAYLNGLAKAITDKGGKIFEQTRVRKPDRSVLETEAGNKVSSSARVVCSSSVQSHAVQRKHMQKDKKIPFDITLTDTWRYTGLPNVTCMHLQA